MNDSIAKELFNELCSRIEDSDECDFLSAEFDEDGDGQIHCNIEGKEYVIIFQPTAIED